MSVAAFKGYVLERTTTLVELGGAGPDAPAPAGAPAPAALSCQHYHNCTNNDTKKRFYKRYKPKHREGWCGEVGDTQGRSWVEIEKGVLLHPVIKLTGQEARAAFVLRGQIVDFIKCFGREHCAFLTMTDAHNLHPKEFARRFHSWRTHEGGWIKGYIRILEPQQRGAPHYHLLVAVAWDMQPDRFDWLAFRAAQDAWKAGDMAAHHAARQRYKLSAAPQTVAIWNRMRKAMPKYGLGRAEFLPLRKEAEAVAGYLGKYLEGGLRIRIDDWKGCRRIERDRKTAKLWNRHHRQFAWLSPGATLWRKRIGELATVLGVTDYEQFKARYGPRWAYRIRDVVQLTGDNEWGELIQFLKSAPFIFDR